jgi:hypothetical protein
MAERRMFGKTIIDSSVDFRIWKELQNEQNHRRNGKRD